MSSVLFCFRKSCYIENDGFPFLEELAGRGKGKGEFLTDQLQIPFQQWENQEAGIPLLHNSKLEKEQFCENPAGNAQVSRDREGKRKPGVIVPHLF